MFILEPMIENLTHLPEVLANGAKRVLIADNLTAGGTTVSHGVMAEAVALAHDHQASLDVWVATSPHLETPLSDLAIRAMEADLFQAQSLGVDGVIFAALTATRQLDTEAMSNLIAASTGMTITFGPVLEQVSQTDWATTFNWLSQHEVEQAALWTTPDQTATALTNRWQPLATLGSQYGCQLVAGNVSDTVAESLNQSLSLNHFISPTYFA